MGPWLRAERPLLIRSPANKALELTGRSRRRASLSSRSAARVGATSPGVRRSTRGRVTGGRQLNAEPLAGVTEVPA